MGIQPSHDAIRQQAEEEQLRRDTTESLGKQIFTLLANNPEYYKVDEHNHQLHALAMLTHLPLPDKVIIGVANAMESSFNKLAQRLNQGNDEGLSITVRAGRAGGAPAFTLSFNNLKAEGSDPQQVKAAITKATAYFFTHRKEIEQGIHDAVFTHASPPNITEELRKAPGTARTLLAASPDPSHARIIAEQHHKNKVEKLAYPLLDLFLGKASYDIAETEEGDKLIASVKLQPGIQKGVLREAMQAMVASFDALNNKLKGQKKEPLSIGLQAYPGMDGSYQVMMLFGDIDKITQKEKAQRYLADNTKDIVQGIRAAIFGEEQARYRQ